MTLYSIVLKLKPESNCLLNSYTGYFSLAIFMYLLKMCDEEDANYFHEKNDLKPFTVSGLLGNFQKFEGKNLCLTGKYYFLRFTFLNEKLFAKFINFLLEKAELKINIQDKFFSLSEICISKEQNYNSGSVDILKFWKKISFLQNSCLLNFLSPTTFKNKKINYVLPKSDLVFSSLLKKLLFIYPDFQNELKDLNINDFFNKIYIAKIINLNTKIVKFKQAKQIGFIGKVGYKIRTKSENDLRLFNLLASLSFYLGVGAKTTSGFGQVRRFYEN
jgi:CRISPR-associated endoribonuclease Cas6